MSNFISNPCNLKLNTQNNHPLIPRANTYWLNRKCLTIHSEDRDISKWPSSSEFEINLPQEFLNIQSSRLIEINLPVNLYNFSMANQNTKFTIIVDGSRSEITIDDGYYTKDQLANTLTNKLNYDVSLNVPDREWKVIYHKTKQKFLFGNNANKFFTLDADVSYNYTLNCNNIQQNNTSVNYFNRYNKWGFLAYIGFNEKKTYISDLYSSSDLYLDYESSNNTWLQYKIDTIYYLEPPSIIDILGEEVIYMEMNYFNNIDELIPWPNSNTNSINKEKEIHFSNPKYVANRGSGINSSFAKITLINNNLLNSCQFTPPLERINRLKFKFRYHDGEIVNFNNKDFTFTLEFNLLRNDFDKKMIINTPQFYSWA
tara:strand:- start:3786 stop:4898 length:1113 start_codon:yes stop_codon:yes gene_type:complete